MIKKQDRLHQIIYSKDSTAGSIKTNMPSEVLFARSREDIIQAVKYANRNNTGLYIRGAGTSTVGNSLPVKKGIVLSLEKMDRMINISPQGRMVTVQPGVTSYQINKRLKEYGLMLAGFPASHKISTIGGNVSTNASGLLGAKYGTIAGYVKRISVITGSGKEIITGFDSQKYSMGIDLKGLFIGSMGLLGIIHELVLEIIPVKKDLKEYTFAFDSPEQVMLFLSDLYNKGIFPEIFEIVNNTISEKLLNDNKYYIIMRAESRIKCDRAVEFMELRKSLSPLITSLKKHKLSFDLCFDLKHIKKFDKIVEQLNSVDVFAGYYGHFMDGIFHLSICYDEFSFEIEKIRKIIYNFITKVNGSISGEHGYGHRYRNIAMKQLRDNLPYIRKIKKIFDPRGVLNRGLEL